MDVESRGERRNRLCMGNIDASCTDRKERKLHVDLPPLILRVFVDEDAAGGKFDR